MIYTIPMIVNAPVANQLNLLVFSSLLLYLLRTCLRNWIIPNRYDRKDCLRLSDSFPSGTSVERIEDV